MRIAIAGGGTGGHVYPGVAVAEEIRRRGGEAFFLGTQRGLESRIVPASGFELVTLPAAPFDRRRFWRLPGTIAENGRGLVTAREILRRRRPALVLGMGGYVSAAACLAARWQGLPLLLHEQNAVAGLANRWLARYARVCLSAWHDEGDPRWPCRVVRVGLPVREAFFLSDRASARARLGLGADDRVLLVFGGSRGAASLNRSMEKIALKLAAGGVTVLWAAGAEQYEAAARGLPATHERVRLVPYIDDMPSYLRAADLAVTRAGAMTVAEIAACGAPSVLVPYPLATDDHQTANARFLVDAGAAELIPDAEVTKRLYDTVTALMGDTGRLAAMSAAAAALSRRDAAARIADILEEIAR